MIDVDSESFLTVVVAAALAAFAAGLVSSRLPLPVVVLEIVLGIAVGPELLGLAEPSFSASANRAKPPTASRPTAMRVLSAPVTSSAIRAARGRVVLVGGSQLPLS